MEKWGGVTGRVLTRFGRLKQYCEEVGFFREKEVQFAHKQSNLMKLTREAWEQPAL